MMAKRLFIFGALALAAAGALLVGGCDNRPRRARTLSAGGRDSKAYITSVAETLNDLAGNVDLNFRPSQPIVTASTSSDGKEVRCLCIANPESPEGPVNYMQCVDGNGKFFSLDVRPGDIVRYYVKIDEESAQMDIVQRKALELRVRRLATRDPENALIIEGELNAAALDPQRIEIWRYSDKRMDAVRASMDRYEKLRQPPRGWEPTPDLGAIEQIVERADQWLRNQNTPAGAKWKPTPLLAELPVALRNAPGVAPVVARDNQQKGTFADWEGRFLEQAMLMRDVSQWARDKRATADDVEVAASLFDWTIRNVQLDGAAAPRIVAHPWQALVYGHGSAAMRAWVFAELCRQREIDVVVLRPKDQATAALEAAANAAATFAVAKAAAAKGEREAADNARREADAAQEAFRKADDDASLLAAALVDGELYLFDPRIGLPLPGEEDRPATLSQLVAKPELIDAWNIDGEVEYKLPAKSLADWDVSLVASPVQMAKRSRAVEEALQGEDYAVLSADADALKATIAKIEGLPAARLWEKPFAALAEEEWIEISQRRQAVVQFSPFAEHPQLWKARLLHFQGEKEAPADQKNDPLAEPRRGHADALRLYQDPSVRPGDAVLAKEEGAKRDVDALSKSNASYWLGLLSYDRGNYDVAADWLRQRSLEAEPNGRWAEGARYNLARTLEQLDRSEEVLKLLEKTPKDSPSYAGNLLLAKRLEKAIANGKTVEGVSDADSASPSKP